MINRRWLPSGTHHGLVIDHRPTGRGGSLIHASRKGVIHSTEGTDFDSMSSVLVGKSAEPHFLLGKVGNRFHVRQYIPLDEGSRALEHPSGTLDTNNAGAVQIEVCAFAINTRAGRKDWSEDTYLALALLALMIEHRVPIARRRPRRFSPTPNRYTQSGFVFMCNGWVGHQHVPSQPSGHWDPGAFRAVHFLDLMNKHAKEVIK